MIVVGISSPSVIFESSGPSIEYEVKIVSEICYQFRLRDQYIFLKNGIGELFVW